MRCSVADQGGDVEVLTLGDEVDVEWRHRQVTNMQAQRKTK